MKKINYRFNPMPSNLIHMLDPYCYMAYSFLLEKWLYWDSKNRLDNGYFHCSIKDLSDELCLKNSQDVTLVLSALYDDGFINIIPSDGKGYENKYSINWDKVSQINKFSLDEIRQFERKTKKYSRGTACSYLQNVDDKHTNCSQIVSENEVYPTTNCSPTLNELEEENEENEEKEKNYKKRKLKDEYVVEFMNMMSSACSLGELNNYKNRLLAEYPKQVNEIMRAFSECNVKLNKMAI